MSTNELRTCLTKQLGLPLTDFEFDSMMKIVDKNKDGQISYTEFARDLALADIQSERSAHHGAVLHEVQHSPHRSVI